MLKLQVLMACGVTSWIGFKAAIAKFKEVHGVGARNLTDAEYMQALEAAHVEDWEDYGEAIDMLAAVEEVVF